MPRLGANADDQGSVAPARLQRALRILLADDSADNRLLIRAYLRKTPWQLDEAADGREAIEMFKRGHYDAVLMDIQMPEVDGYEATRAFRRWERDHGLPRTPVLALTASGLEDAAALIVKAGCDAHITKPVKRATLLSKIGEALQPHQEHALAPESCNVEES
jgi:two-component system, sensor histidine kinase and response regulator